jgi:hypothetical protein
MRLRNEISERSMKMALKGKSVAGANQRSKTKDVKPVAGKRRVEASLESSASQIGSAFGVSWRPCDWEASEGCG